MNRTSVIVLALFLIATGTALGFLLMRLQDLPPDARAALNAYIDYHRSALSPTPLTLSQAAYAGNPSHFSAEMSGASFSVRQFYRTTYSLRADAAPGLTPVPTVPPQGDNVPLSSSIKSTTFSSRGAVAIPFPPIELWCLVMTGEGTPPSIVYVALHRDLYYADWLVHEPPTYANTGELNRKLGDIGCNLSLAQTQ